jgi:hypothetical protein
MITEELYKEKICSNCANENCERLELVTMKIDTTIVIKCKGFIRKNKRKCIGFRGGY